MFPKIFFFGIFITSCFGFAQNNIPAASGNDGAQLPTLVNTRGPVKMNSDPDHIYDEVEELAEYPGGIKVFRSRFSGRFDASKIERTGLSRTELSFIIDKEGNITDILAVGGNKIVNDEAIRTLKTIKEVWTPAKINGQAVKYRFRLPLAFNF